MYLACSAPFLVNGCVIMKCPIAAVSNNHLSPSMAAVAAAHTTLFPRFHVVLEAGKTTHVSYPTLYKEWRKKNRAVGVGWCFAGACGPCLSLGL